jgi:beta-glucanase (GH16 family)
MNLRHSAAARLRRTVPLPVVVGLLTLVLHPGGHPAASPLKKPTAGVAQPAPTTSAATNAPVAGTTGVVAPAAVSVTATPSAAPPAPLWADEFNGAAGARPDPAKWGYDVGGNGWGNRELETYTSRTQNASTDGSGHLAITVRREAYTGTDGLKRDYTSARLTTRSTFTFQYGTVEARIKVPAGTGLWPAFWMLGADIASVGWPWCGELDAMETVNNATVMGVTAWGPNPSTAQAWRLQQLGTGNYSSDYHVYTLHWSPSSVSVSIDGVPFGTVLKSQLPAGAVWEFDQPMFLLLDVAVGGTGPAVSPDATTALPASMLVDWVRVYSS